MRRVVLHESFLIASPAVETIKFIRLFLILIFP
jgi:hypothetical protein